MRAAAWVLLLCLAATATAEMTLNDIEIDDEAAFDDTDLGEEESPFDAMDELELGEDTPSCISVGPDCTVVSSCPGSQQTTFRCANYQGKGAYKLTFGVDKGANEKVPGCTQCSTSAGGPIMTSNRGIRNSNGCKRLGGSCWNTQTSRCAGETKSGLCPGKSHIKCCIPGSVEQGPKCVARKGVCINSHQSPCTGELHSGMCPGPSHYKCCAPPGVPPPLDNTGGIRNPGPGPRPRPAARVTCQKSSSGMKKLVPIPTDLIRNQLGLTYPKQSSMKSLLGTPCPLRKDCGGITNKNLLGKLKRGKVGHIRIYGMNAAVDSLERILSRVRRDLPDVFRYVKSSGMVCCRAIRGSKKSFSNHSWGMAIDFNIDGTLDPRKDAKTQCALLAMWPYFNEEGWFWAAGYSAKYEDAMHFEVAEQTVAAWRKAGKI